MFFEKLLMMIVLPFFALFSFAALAFVFIFTWFLIPFMTFERQQEHGKVTYKVTRIFGRSIL
jgi:hypothetical protein